MAYSYEDRKRAVELYAKYGKKAAAVIAELGYPTPPALRGWYKDYVERGEVRLKTGRSPKHSEEQRKAAVDHYLEHGKCLSFTKRELGYPASSQYLREWIDELAPGERRKTVHTPSCFTYDEQVEAVIALDVRGQKPAAEVASALGTSRSLLYQWKYKHLGKKARASMKKPPDNASDQVEELLDQVANLQAQVRELELRKDILEGAVGLLGKKLGTDPKRLPNREKTLLIEVLRDK